MEEIGAFLGINPTIVLEGPGSAEGEVKLASIYFNTVNEILWQRNWIMYTFDIMTRRNLIVHIFVIHGLIVLNKS